MKKLQHHFYFWSLGIIYVVSFLYTSNFDEFALDFNVHDTYFVILKSHTFIIPAILFIIIGIIYWSYFKMKVNLIKSLSNVHTYITTIGALLYLLGPLFFYENSNPDEFPLFDNSSSYHLFITIIFLFAFIAQLIFILNLLISTLRHAIQRNYSE